MKRTISEQLAKHILNHKLLLLQGTKGLEKKELVQNALNSEEELVLFEAGDKHVKKTLETAQENDLLTLFSGKKFVYIEDAQFLTNLQNIIEYVLFNDWNICLILSCSYEPAIDEVLREALILQGLEICVYPATFQELANEIGLVEFDKTIEQRILFGSYPEVLKNKDEAEAYLRSFVKEVIFTNLSSTERINKEQKLFKMLQILAYEIGEPISYNDVGFRAGLDNETVERYIDLLEKAHVLLRLPSFYNGHKYELKKTHTVYFLDNGIRNAVIQNFLPLDMRNDTEQLWKNWLISERFKWNKLNNSTVKSSFWRTHTRQQMDLIEENNGTLSAYTCLWDKRRKPKIPTSFKQHYPDAGTLVLNRATYWGFLSKK